MPSRPFIGYQRLWQTRRLCIAAEPGRRKNDIHQVSDKDSYGPTKQIIYDTSRMRYSRFISVSGTPVLE